MNRNQPASDWIRGLSPYQSLALFAAPLAIIEPLKLAAVFVAGDGHWFTGIVVEVIAYTASFFVTHRLFQILKPKLLQIAWFERFWNWCMFAVRRAKRWFSAE